MFKKSMIYFQTLILRNRRMRKCTESQARRAWKQVSFLTRENTFNEAFVHVLHDIALYGKALRYNDVIHGMSLSLKEDVQ
jgi:hypothetical protein